MKSNQGGSDETRIDELDFFGALAQSYGNRRVSDIFQALNDDYTVQLVISVACGSRKECSQEIVRRVSVGKFDPVSQTTCKVAPAGAKATGVSELRLTDRHSVWLTYFHSLPLRVRPLAFACCTPPHVVVSEERWQEDQIHLTSYLSHISEEPRNRKLIGIKTGTFGCCCGACLEFRVYPPPRNRSFSHPGHI